MRITSNHLGRRFKRLHFLLEQNMNRKLQELDLTNAQGHIIGYLSHSEQPPCARDLEDAFGLSHPTVSGLLSRMEAKGFIEIRADEKDRRVKRLFLLEKGMACSRSIAERIEESEAQMTRGFSPEELEQFHSCLQRICQNLSENPTADERSKP